MIQWLLDGDPAIRWQVMHDVVGAAERTVERERRRVASDGWGARLLARQDSKGSWARRLSSGGGWAKWTRASETCISGMVLPLLSYFEFDDARVDTVADHVLGQQMSDGGWNCERPRGANHSSFHTTISVLEGLRLYEVHRRRKVRAVRAAQRSGREVLLVHRFFRSHRTGDIIKPILLRLSFPPRWHYDILRALDYFQAVNAPRDKRLIEAIEILRNKQRKDGCCTLENRYKGKTYFELERPGAPSRWNTLRALRVLDWYSAQG